MHRLAMALLERETLDAIEIRALIDDKELPPLRPQAADQALPMCSRC